MSTDYTEQIMKLRADGKSYRTIATELNVGRYLVEKTLRNAEDASFELYKKRNRKALDYVYKKINAKDSFYTLEKIYDEACSVTRKLEVNYKMYLKAVDEFRLEAAKRETAIAEEELKQAKLRQEAETILNSLIWGQKNKK